MFVGKLGGGGGGGGEVVGGGEEREVRYTAGKTKRHLNFYFFNFNQNPNKKEQQTQQSLLPCTARYHMSCCLPCQYDTVHHIAIV